MWQAVEHVDEMLPAIEAVGAAGRGNARRVRDAVTHAPGDS